jgi:predicted nucleic acid-binding protein
MRKVLIDTNVVLDVLLEREPHVSPSTAVWAAVETGRAQGFLAAHAMTTIHYLIRKELGLVKARRIISVILRIFSIAGVDGAVIQGALQLSLTDFEDAVTVSAASVAGCDFIITRDAKGFRGSPVRILTPEQAVALLSS